MAVFALAIIFGGCDHEWAEATCTEPRTCLKCKTTEGKALGHDWADATCEKPKTCKRCQETDGQALGHSVSDWTIDSESTCVEKGKRHGTCARCKEVVSEDLPLASHTEGEWQVVEEPKLTSGGASTDGVRALLCSVCGKQIRTEKFSLSAEEIEAAFKEECESPSFDNVARDPDAWEGKKVAFRGKVIQVMQSGNGYTLRVNVTQGRYTWSDTIMVYYEASSGSSRILEDDVITFYGTMRGMYSYTSVLGAEITVPLLAASFIQY